MALFNNIPQHLAVRDLQILIARNNQQQQILLVALFEARRRAQEEEDRRARRPRRWWVKPWIARRALHGQYYNLFAELDQECDMDYMSYIRIDRNMFAELLARVGPRIQKSQRWVHNFGGGITLILLHTT
jgi:hypothetical protein